MMTGLLVRILRPAVEALVRAALAELCGPALQRLQDRVAHLELELRELRARLNSELTGGNNGVPEVP